MSKLTDRISYLKGLAEGMKLNTEKDSNRLILEMIDVLGEVGDAFEALAEAHAELDEFVESIDEDLAELEDAFFEDEEEDESGDEEEDLIQYECPHCGEIIEIDPDDVDFEEDAVCPSCGKELFPELPDDAEEDDEDDSDDGEDEDDSGDDDKD